jgi:hypothetical protein
MARGLGLHQFLDGRNPDAPLIGIHVTEIMTSIDFLYLLYLFMELAKFDSPLKGQTSGPCCAMI